MNLQNFYKLFVGNPNSHIIWNTEKNYWKRSFLKITKNLLIKHLNKEIVIGSYPIYKKDGKVYCRWICIDCDSHMFIPENIIEDVQSKYEEEMADLIIRKLEKEYSKRVDKETKKKQGEFMNYLYLNSHLIGLPKSCLLLEDSVGGYHLWIILNNYTLLIDVGKYVFKFKNVINDIAKNFYYGEEPEIYPKQYNVEHLNKKLGNAVRLPLGRNFGRDGDCEIIAGSIDKLKPVDLKPIVKEISTESIKNFNGFNKDFSEPKQYQAKSVSMDLEFWLEFPLRPCFKRVIRGETQCHGHSYRGHRMRMGLVHECRYFNIPFEVIVECFANQVDFDRQKTIIQTDSVIKGSKFNGRYSCNKIKELGYCHNCKL